MEIIEPEDPLKVQNEEAIVSPTPTNPKGRPSLHATVQFCSQPKSFVSRMLCNMRKGNNKNINWNDIQKRLSGQLSENAMMSADTMESPASHDTLRIKTDGVQSSQTEQNFLKRQLNNGEKCDKRCKTMKELKNVKDTSFEDEAEPLPPNQFFCDYSDCKYRTNLMCNLSKHKRIHTDEKPYLCDQCPFRTNFVNSLKVHKRIHTSERPYCCDQCGYKCNSISNLKKHKHHKHAPG